VPALPYPALPDYPQYPSFPVGAPPALFELEGYQLHLPSARSVDVLLIVDEHAEHRLSAGLEERDRQRVVQQALNALPPLKRKVVELVFWDDMPQVMVAKVCDISPARVNQILKESFATMRPIVAPLMH
jgi:RNA polymerase sigma factor (sigma-70 family)